MIPGSGRSPREGIGYPLQYSWASLVAQLVKNLPAMCETWRRSLGEGNVNPLQYSCLENRMDRGAWQATVHGVAKSWTWLSSKAQHAQAYMLNLKIFGIFKIIYDSHS